MPAPDAERISRIALSPGSLPVAAAGTPLVPLHRLALRSGGAVVLGCEGVNLFTLDEPERALFVEFAAAIKKYERAIGGPNADRA